MPTRREFIRWTAASGVGVAVGGLLPTGRVRTALAASTASVGSGLTPYVDPMPILADNAIDARGGGPVNLTASLISSKVHRDLKPTTLFGYTGGPHDGGSYLGPVILAQSGMTVKASYKNAIATDDYLRVFTNPPGSSYTQFNKLGAQILTHLHGGLLAGFDDGNPHATGAYASGQTQTATYPNAGLNLNSDRTRTSYPHPASLLWYHDHLVGATRMNVVAGLAGGYLLRDVFDTGSNQLLPGPIGVYELPLVVQDRQFNADGSLLYPIAPASTNGPWIGEYFGDAMLVNG